MCIGSGERHFWQEMLPIDGDTDVVPNLMDINMTWMNINTTWMDINTTWININTSQMTHIIMSGKSRVKLKGAHGHMIGK